MVHKILKWSTSNLGKYGIRLFFILLLTFLTFKLVLVSDALHAYQKDQDMTATYVQTTFDGHNLQGDGGEYFAFIEAEFYRYKQFEMLDYGTFTKVDKNVYQLEGNTTNQFIVITHEGFYLENGEHSEAPVLKFVQLSDIPDFINLSGPIQLEANLKKELLKLGIDKDQDGEINFIEACSVKGYLDLEGKHLTDIEGLQYFYGVTDINVSNNNITQVTPIFKLRNLKTLNISRTVVRHLDGIDALKKLVKLAASNCELVDISLLKACAQLEDLVLVGNHIKEVTPLSELTKLRRLSLTGNKITDISPLKTLTQLRHLSIGGNEIESIEAVSEMSLLEGLWLYDTNVSQLEALSSLTHLETLDISNTKVQDLSPLESIFSLTKLSIKNLDIVVGLERDKVKIED